MALEEWEKLGIPNVRKFSDVIETEPPWEMTHADLVGETFVITKFVPITTNIGEAFLATIMLNGEERRALIGGMVLKDQLVKMRKQLPLEMTVEKVKNYYTFADAS